ncbi:MAG TPA: agmatine deiminase family protein [Planctomycetaceae bacterium]|nr:agmatine deiminase family protein [Planctomycetaceae bacterium]
MNSPSTAEATPKQLGYRLPAEWEPHEATWLSWPHKEASWPGKIETIFPVYAQMVAALARSETVHINVNDEDMEAKARGFLDAARAAGDIRFHRFPTNDAWCRDHGAIILRHRDSGRAQVPRLAIDWDYNAWGNKYPPHDLDNLIPGRMAETLGIPCRKGGMVLEGGSIDSNGEGLLLTTTSCLLNPNRNPGLSRTQIEARLLDMLGVEKILWLGDGIVGDDTDGHIDDLTRFVGPRTVVTAIEDDPADANFAPLRENLRRLETMTDLEGRRLEIIPVPMPPTVVYEGQRLPASYANFYIANTLVLLPTYNHPNDAVAQNRLAEVFPGREVIGLDCTDLIWGLGAFHCLTQQVPKATSSRLRVWPAWAC